jgi:hypothetical protein
MNLRNIASTTGSRPVRPPGSRCRAFALLPGCRAFTLLEVMVACAMFFIATFAILALVASTLRNARVLERGDVDVGIAAAQVYQTLKTNKQTQFNFSGDFGDTYPSYSWTASVDEYMTNGLLQVEVVLSKRGRGPVDSLLFWVYSPDAKSTQLGAPRIR